MEVGEHVPGQAHPGGDEIAAGSERELLRTQFRELTQTSNWLQICATMLRDDPSGLPALLDPAGANFAALQKEGPAWPHVSSDRGRKRNPDSALADEGDDAPALSAAQAVLSVALALADPASATTELSRSIEHWRRAQIVPDAIPSAIPTALFAQPNQRLRSVLHHVDELADGPPAAYTALIALALLDTLKPMAQVEVPVLFDRHHSGGTATLRLTTLLAGPTGLYPDPHVMPFLTSDAEFAAALRAAWLSSLQRLDSCCVTWAIVNNQNVPCNEIVRGSLGAAFAVALDELACRLSRFAAMRPKRLDQRCAVTGAIGPGQTLRPVRGYENKIDAARRAELRVVIPRPSEREVAPIAERMRVRVDFASDVKEAIRLTRTRLNRRLIAGLAAVVVLLGSAGGALYQQHRVAIGLGLLATADELRDSQPATSMALDVEAVHLAPGPDTRAHLLRAVAQPHYLAKATDQTVPNKVLLSADGHRLLTANSTATLWEVRNRHQLTQVSSWGGTVQLEQVALSPDGNLVATAASGGTVQVWDVRRSEQPVETGRFVTGSYRSMGLAFSRDGSQLNAVGVGDRVVIWDVARHEQAGSFPMPKPKEIDFDFGQHWGTVFSPDLDALATVEGEDAVALWALTDRSRIARAATVPAGPTITSVNFRPVGHELAVADHDGVTLWDISALAHPARLGLIAVPGGANDVAFSPRGDLLATVGTDGSLTLWNIANRAQPSVVAKLMSKSAIAVAFGADGHTVATTGRDGTVSLWDVPIPLAVSVLIDKVAGGIEAADYAPDSRTLAVAAQGKVVIWDVSDSGKPVPTAVLEVERVRAVRFGSNGRTLAAATDTGKLLTWDVSDRTRPQSLTAVLDPVVFSTPSQTEAFSRDGRWLALPTSGQTITVWDTAGFTHLTRLVTLDTGETTVYGVALSSDGHYLAAVGDRGTIMLWDLTRPDHPVATRRVNTTYLTAVTFSSDNRLLAVGGAAGAVVLWDVSAPPRPIQLAAPGGASGTVNAVVFSPDTPDARILVTAGDQRTAEVWSVSDPSNPVLLATAAGFPASIGEVAWAPDGRTLLTGSKDQDAVLWDVTGVTGDPNRAIKEICAIAGSRLSGPDWRHYLPGLGYHPTC
ncbi:MAG: hypothetical protein WCF33_01895 [Pseudonocardiaceae bacterium]